MVCVTTVLRLALALVGVGILAGPAGAEVTAAAPDRLEFRFAADVAMPKDKLWARIVKPGSWWSDAHTYSGKAANMKLAEKAGGCWCETWPGGQAEHGRVLFIAPGGTLRLAAALGPFQDMGVTGVMTITIEPGADADHSKLKLTYKVSGSSLLKLDQMAAPVNGVLGEQFAKLSAP